MRPAIISEESLTVVVDGKPYTIPSNHRNFDKVKKGVFTLSDQALLAMLSKEAEVKKNFRKMKAGTVEVKDGEVYFNGEVLHNSITRRLLQMLDDGIDIKPIRRFLERVMENPSAHSVAELYTFLEKNKIPLTDDGCFLGYKYVNADYTDVYSSKIDNRVGAKIPRLKRNQVNDDWRVKCSSGYHVGSYEYAWDGPGRRRMIVKVDPADVVAVSVNENKCRVCWYEVVSELEDKRTALDDLYDDRFGGEYNDDEDYDEDDYEDDYDDGEEDYDYDNTTPTMEEIENAAYREFLSRKAANQKRGPGGKFSK